MNRVVAYVDGFNLYFGLKSMGWQRYYWLDVPALVENLLLPGQHLVETKYFTSRVSASAIDRDKPKRQSTYLEALTRLALSYRPSSDIISSSRSCATIAGQLGRNTPKR